MKIVKYQDDIIGDILNRLNKNERERLHLSALILTIKRFEKLNNYFPMARLLINPEINSYLGDINTLITFASDSIISNNKEVDVLEKLLKCVRLLKTNDRYHSNIKVEMDKLINDVLFLVDENYLRRTMRFISRGDELLSKVYPNIFDEEMCKIIDTKITNIKNKPTK